MRTPRVDRWLDLLDRVGWTAVQAAAAALLTYLASGRDLSWNDALAFVGFATLASVLKVVIAQRTGTDDSGSLIGRPVIIPEPTAKPEEVKKDVGTAST